jgi:hypothetical protein
MIQQPPLAQYTAGPQTQAGLPSRSQYLARILSEIGGQGQMQSVPQAGLDLSSVALANKAQQNQQQDMLAHYARNADYNTAAASNPYIPWHNLPTSPYQQQSVDPTRTGNPGFNPIHSLLSMFRNGGG